MGFNWGGKKWRPADVPKKQPKINQSIEELLKPLSEKTWKGNVWGSQIMNVEKETAPDVSPTPTPTVTPTQSVTPSITPSVTPSISVTPSLTPTKTPTPTVTPTPSPLPLSFQQTDSNFTNGNSAACSAYVQPADAYHQKTATVGGSAGTASFQIDNSNNSAQWGLQHKLTIPSGTSWNAGTWTVRLQVGSSGNNNVKLIAVYICRVNSSNVSQATIGSNTSVNTTITANSVITVNVTGSAQTPSANDYVNIVYVFENTIPTPSTLSFTVKSNQIINSPYI